MVINNKITLCIQYGAGCDWICYAKNVLRMEKRLNMKRYIENH